MNETFPRYPVEPNRKPVLPDVPQIPVPLPEIFENLFGSAFEVKNR